MKRSRFSETQIVGILRGAYAGNYPIIPNGQTVLIKPRSLQQHHLPGFCVVTDCQSVEISSGSVAVTVP